MNGRGEPNWQPISMRAMIAPLIDEDLRDGHEHYAALLEARRKPHVRPADATITRQARHGRGLHLADIPLEVWK